MGVESNFPLSNDGFLVPVDKFDGVFDGDDVADSVALRDSRPCRSKVVDLPDPVAPTTSTNPRFDMVISFSMSGNPSSCRDDTWP